MTLTSEPAERAGEPAPPRPATPDDLRTLFLFEALTEGGGAFARGISAEDIRELLA